MTSPATGQSPVRTTPSSRATNRCSRSPSRTDADMCHGCGSTGGVAARRALVGPSPPRGRRLRDRIGCARRWKGTGAINDLGARLPTVEAHTHRPRGPRPGRRRPRSVADRPDLSRLVSLGPPRDDGSTTCRRTPTRRRCRPLTCRSSRSRSHALGRQRAARRADPVTGASDRGGAGEASPPVSNRKVLR